MEKSTSLIGNLTSWLPEVHSLEKDRFLTGRKHLHKTVNKLAICFSYMSEIQSTVF
jgi:hypothetical protein